MKERKLNKHAVNFEKVVTMGKNGWMDVKAVSKYSL
jgi:hypothetical protein